MRKTAPTIEPLNGFLFCPINSPHANTMAIWKGDQLNKERHPSQEISLLSPHHRRRSNGFPFEIHQSLMGKCSFAILFFIFFIFFFLFFLFIYRFWFGLVYFSAAVVVLFCLYFVLFICCGSGVVPVTNGPTLVHHFVKYTIFMFALNRWNMSLWAAVCPQQQQQQLLQQQQQQ